MVCLVTQVARAAANAETVRFVSVDVMVDSGAKGLAAWQVEVKTIQGDVRIVGVEGGDCANVYRDPPYYDPAALAGGRIIVASYTTAPQPPAGKVRVARLHLQVRGEYQLSAEVMASADGDAKAISATARVVQPTTTTTRATGREE